MEPLLPNRNRTSDINNINSSSKWKSCKAGCIFVTIAVLLVFVIYFSFFGSHSLNNSNQAISLLSSSINDEDNEQKQKTQDKSIKTQSLDDFYKPDGHDDLITTLPYLVEESCSLSATNCGFNQYSGYLLTTDDNELHYWFIEADVVDPLSRPVFIWTNGGPGCSGMDGLLTEMGTWKVTDSLELEYNPYTWTTEVNMVFLEQPYGVGFSACDDDDVVSGDLNAARDMDVAIRNFLEKFPEYADSKIYTSAESWGGHYVPMTAWTILTNNDAGDTPYINYGGYLLGNPYTDYYENIYGFVGDLFGHGLVKSSDWDTWRAECWDDPEAIDYSDTCYAIYVCAYYASYNANVYALDWPQCQSSESWDDDWSSTSSPSSTTDTPRVLVGSHQKRKAKIMRGKMQRASHIHKRARTFMNKLLSLSSDDYDVLPVSRIDRDDLQRMYDAIDRDNEYVNSYDNNGRKLLTDQSTDESKQEWDNYEPCAESDMANYLNLEEVQLALNVKPTLWGMCSDPVYDAWPDEDYYNPMEDYHTTIVNNWQSKYNLTLSIYSGDDDSVCGLEGTGYWLDRWNFDANSNMNWQEWEDDNTQLGGFYTQYLNDDGDVALHFITIRTAGHMVPTTEPARALTLLQKYLYEFSSTAA